MNETTEREEAQTGSVSLHDRMVIFPTARPGICIRNDAQRRTVNVHFVRDKQVFYGLYDDREDNAIDDGLIGAYRVEEEGFNGVIREAIEAGHSVFTLLER